MAGACGGAKQEHVMEASCLSHSLEKKKRKRKRQVTHHPCQQSEDFH
jgi:ribosomal protein L35